MARALLIVLMLVVLAVVALVVVLIVRAVRASLRRNAETGFVSAPASSGVASSYPPQPPIHAGTDVPPART